MIIFKVYFSLKIIYYYIFQFEGGDLNYNILLVKNKMLVVIRKNNRNIEIIFLNFIKSYFYVE